ncbi:hypothetical protein L1987_64982 [Smallanthus sonchifolius]|uniref:Uncharacterized protein n=1 Tax=Smallanthus sonchifolius TaxID=185202 RepID=A0ACB9BT80_9ASTR|nr:hypothetical protein L1987_64982 [Smallanthus sonchifolius]
MSSSHNPVEISDSEDESVEYHPASETEESRSLYETVSADPIPSTTAVRKKTSTYDPDPEAGYRSVVPPHLRLHWDSLPFCIRRGKEDNIRS